MNLTFRNSIINQTENTTDDKRIDTESLYACRKIICKNQVVFILLIYSHEFDYL